MRSNCDSFYLSTFFLVVFLLLINGISAQPGFPEHATYLVRDETGKEMSLKELENASIQVNGISLHLNYSLQKQPAYYEHEFVEYFDEKLVSSKRGIRFSNPLTISLDPYRTVGDLMITHRGKRMRLFFDLDSRSLGAFDSLPFQSGSFFLKNNSWEAVDDNWVRRPVWNNYWITGTKIEPAKCNSSINVVNNQKDWIEAWDTYQSREAEYTVFGSNENVRAPAIDFRNEMILVLYVRNSFTLGRQNYLFFVDKNGNMTFRPPEPAKRWLSNACSMLVVSFYRSGIRSIEGKVLNR